MTEPRFEDTARVLLPKLNAAANKWLGEGNGAEEPEDVVQEALMRLWLWYNKRGAPQNPEAMAMTMVKNICIDHQRRRQLSFEITGALTSRKQRPVDEALMEKESSQRLDIAMRKLSPNRRRILYMRGQGMSIEEIAAICNTTYNSTKTIISAARRELFRITNGGKDL